MSKITFETLNARIAAIRSSESITKKELAAFSRESLQLLVESEDVRAINSLLGYAEDGKFVLSPLNRKMAGMFFKTFVAFSLSENDGVLVQFGKKKAKVWDKRADEIAEFLADASNDIWSWAAANIEMEKKAPEYAGKVQKLIEKSLTDKEYAISQVDVLKAVMAGGVSVDALIELASLLSQPAVDKAA